MFRISGSCEAKRLHLEGRLAEGWVDELSRVVASGEEGITLDLQDLTFADARGAALLRDLHGRGAAVVGGSAFIQRLLWGNDDDASR